VIETKFRLYGRRKGRPLRLRKQDLWQSLLPQVELALPPEGAVLNLEALFPAAENFWLEIGFGGGEHLAAIASQHPQDGFIGCEPFVNGTASLLEHLDDGKIQNVRVTGDARPVLEALPASSLKGAYLLYPDPWPKKKHIERRFLVQENLDRLHRVLAPGGLLYLASDVAQLSSWMREQVEAHAGFALIQDGTTPPEGWVPTRYEQKGLAAGRTPVYLVAVKKKG